MKWLFLFFVLDTSLNDAKPRVMVYRAFASEQSCNAFGRSFDRTKYTDRSLKSFSICVPKSAYAETGVQSMIFD